MNKKTLNQFIPHRQLIQEGKTLDAVYFHFLDGLSIPQSAKKAGISNQAAHIAINRISEKLLIAGFRNNWIKEG